MADEVARLNIPEYDRSDVLPCFLSWASASSIAASHAISSLPNPQLDKYRTVVGELILDGFVGLPIGDLALLPVQRPFGTVVDVHIVYIRIYDPPEGRLAVDLLNRQNIRIEEPHIAANPLVIRGDAFH